ncbi:MAG: hypothetical protein ACI9OU_000720 [Candidatus Promineifilaceae bacterium]|jgi:hypothetical protein
MCLSLLSPPHSWANVVISEIHYAPVGGSTYEFIELYNPGTNVLSLEGWHFSDGADYGFPNGTQLAPSEYLIVAANQAAFGERYPTNGPLAPGNFAGKLGNQGERLALADAAGSLVFDVTFDNVAPWPAAAAGAGSSLVIVDPFAPENDASNWRASAEPHGSPGHAGGIFVRDIVINEVLAHTDPPLEDAVELHNLTTNPVSIAGWYLSDDKIERKKYRFPDGTVMAPLGYHVIYQEDMLGTNALAPFSISSKGDDVYLSEADPGGNITRFVDDVAFDPTKNGVAFGRYPDGADDLILLSAPTFGVSVPSTLAEFRTGAGARNAGPWVGSVVINEIMYHPPLSNTLGRMRAEYIELLNTSASPVPLFHTEHPAFTWALTGGISYSIPSNTVLNPGQYLVVVGTNDVATFRQDWGISTNVIVLGPFSNALNNASETIRLRAPNTPEPPDNLPAFYVVDDVTYDDQSPWPLAADGQGGSLERNNPLSYGNTPGNWHSLTTGGTPGTTNSVFIPPGAIIISEIMAVNRNTIQDEDGDFSDWIELYNTTGQAVSLAGWHLSDQTSIPTQWTFPDVTIDAHSYLIVFASQKHRTNDINNLHANFSLDANGEYLGLFRDDLAVEFEFAPSFPPQFADVSYGIEELGGITLQVVAPGSSGRYLVPTNAPALAPSWATRTFDDNSWSPAGNGIGYDTEPSYLPYIQTDLRTEMHNITPSAFVRYSFLLENSADVESTLLRIMYEDGFAAWINGVPVASNNTPAALAWNSFSSAARDDSLAVTFVDVDLSPFNHLLVDGENVLAFQALNRAANSSDLLLRSELQILWPPQTTGVSIVAGYLSPATPASGNGTARVGATPTPVLSNPGGTFTGFLSVTVTCANAQADIRYTLDGTQPTPESLPYSTPLQFTNTVELHVRAFVPDWAPSPTVGAVYRTNFLGINEFLASNATATPEIADFTDFADWIELYNASDQAVDLSGYFLTDNLDAPFRWRIPNGATIPAHGHFLVWADGYDSYPGRNLTRPFWPNASFTTRFYHSNFKLSPDSDAIGLFSPSGGRIDAVSYSEQTVDISCGRFPDGSANWGYFGHPTANATNRAPALTHNYLRAAPVIIGPTNDALIVTGIVNVVLSSEPSASEIRYTTDGSTPNDASLLYTQSVALVNGGVIRARTYAPDRHPGPVATRTFLRDARIPELPIISLVIDPFLLYDPVQGIYDNILKKREIPGNIELWTSPTQKAFQIDAGFRLFGLNTFLFAQKPFTVFLDNDYGYPELNVPLFPPKPIGTFDRFVLRNGNDDWAETFLRDTLGQKMLSGVINNAIQSFRPCASYLNGSYYGLINIQEKMDEMYCAKNYGINIENIDFFENDGLSQEAVLNAGAADGWIALKAYLAANSLSDPAHYEYVKQQVDIEDLVDYVAGQIFAYDSSWTHNRKWWRDRTPGGRWRWCFVDLDRALTPGNVGANVINSMAVSMEVFRELLDNTEFRAYAAQRIMAHLNSSFSPTRILPIIDSESQHIRSEIEQHALTYASSGGIPSVGTWDGRIEAIRNYARQRPDIAMQHVASYFGGGPSLGVPVTQVGAGRVLANFVALHPNATNYFVDGMPIQFSAKPDIGHRFVRWDVSGEQSQVQNLVESGSVWRYQDAVTNDIPGWELTNFNDAGWSSGNAQLGYGDGDESTTLDFGGNASDKRLTYYFRKSVLITNVASFSRLDLGLLRDDGAVLYINGQEVLRSNMPTGQVDRLTSALTAMVPAVENFFNTYDVSLTNLVEGTNVFAVEIHQIHAGSSDLGFDISLNAVQNISGAQAYSDPQIALTSSIGLAVEAVFAPTGQSVLPEVLVSNLTLQASHSPYLASGDIFVPSNISMVVEAGTTILMPDGASIYVEGELAMLGSSTAKVYVASNPDFSARSLLTDSNLSNRAAYRWGCIAFDHATHTGRLINVVLRGASVAGINPSDMKAAISARDTDLFMHAIDVDDVGLPVYVQGGDSTVLQNSRLHIAQTGDAINLKRTRYARIENCDITGGTAIDADAIDYDGINGGIIRGNRLTDFTGDNNDAIDIGEGASALIIESNFVARIADKAISIGQGSTAEIRFNVIRDCTTGVGIKDTGSFGFLDHNTFHKTGVAVDVFEKNRGAGGGQAVVQNCILSETDAGPIVVDSLSSAQVSYCLSDTLPIPGTGNRSGEPQFENAKRNNFRLQTGSAAIDGGLPSYQQDADGSPTDIGALPFDWREGHAVISEIHYHPAHSNDSEFIEIYNAGGAALDMNGWHFSAGIDFEFPTGVIIPAGHFLVVAADTNSMESTSAVIAWTNGVLNNAGETLQLRDGGSNEMDDVTYSPGFPWPTSPGGQGPSLALIHPHWDNQLPESWYASALTNGTAGSRFANALPGGMHVGLATNGALQITAGVIDGALYSIDHTESLTPPNWISLGTSASVAGQLTFSHTTNAPVGFYRLRIISP